MGPGKAFELFVKRILVNIGFSEVVSDGLYIYDGTPGQMIQGLGEAHNADVLLEPPAQTPFYADPRGASAPGRELCRHGDSRRPAHR